MIFHYQVQMFHIEGIDYPGPRYYGTEPKMPGFASIIRLDLD
jgi:hypothetical protein